MIRRSTSLGTKCYGNRIAAHFYDYFDLTSSVNSSFSMTRKEKTSSYIYSTTVGNPFMPSNSL